MTAAAIAHRPQRIRSQTLRQALIPFIVAFAATVVATLGVDHIAFLTNANRFLGDWETAALPGPSRKAPIS